MKVPLSKKRKWFLLVLSILLVFFIIYIGWHHREGRGSKSATGIYLASGGETLLVLKTAPLGRLKVSGTRIISARYFMSPKDFSIKASFTRGRLGLLQREIYMDSGSDYSKSLLILALEPSQTIPGDWDLIGGRMKGAAKKRKSSLFKRSFWIDEIFASRNAKDALSKLCRLAVPQTWDNLELDPSRGPFPSFLHKLNDERIVDYFQKRLDTNISGETLQLIRQIAKDHGKDPYLSLHLLEMEIMMGNLEEAESLWKEWTKSHRNHPDPFLLNSAREVFKSLCMRRIKTNHPSLPNLDDVFGKTPQNLDAAVSWLQNFWATDQLYFTSPRPLVPSDVPTGSSYFAPVPGFLGFQVKVKVCRTLALFYLFQSRREESLSLLAGLYRLGQSLNSERTLIQRLIGIAIRGIAVNGLQCYVLNACETEEDFRKCQEALSRLHETPGMDVAENIFVGEFSFLRSRMIETSPPYSNYLEGATRHKVGDMKFELVRMAAAVKHHVTTTGEFPSAETDLSSFLGGEIPKNAFNEIVPLKFLCSTGNEAMVYSHGPDKDDDKASTEYDPTNGTISNGDILIRIPKEREYPFPREPVRTANAYELLMQLPNGLPADTFADTKGRPFSIIESTENHPVTIFSFGPDTDEAVFRPYVKGSPGDSGEGFVPVPTPAPPPNASYGRSLQWVMRRSDIVPPPPGCWTLEPMYDPTNGLVSPGDLFLEIPR